MHFGVAIWNKSTSNIQIFSFLFMKNTKSEDGKAAFKGPSLVFACSLWRINLHNSKSEHLTNIKKAHSLLGTSHNYLTNILKHCNNQHSVKWAAAPTFWRVWAHCTETLGTRGGPFRSYDSGRFPLTAQTSTTIGPFHMCKWSWGRNSRISSH